MNKLSPSQGGSSSALHRLPPGRHGLSREFVTRNQRDRIAAGIIAVVAEHGYHNATIAQISAAAGVSRRTFYGYFSSKEECFFDAYSLIAAHLRQAATEDAAEFTEWPDRVRAKVAAVLEVFAANPDLVRFFMIAPARAGNDIAARYRETTDYILLEITEGMPAPPATRVPSEAAQFALLGGVAALIVRKVEAGDASNLDQLLPELLELVLTPYLGRERAVGLAQRPG